MNSTEMDAPRRLLTPAEAAEYLNVSERWIRDNAQQRRLPYVRMGKFLRFDPDDLDDYRNTHRVRAVEG